MRNTLVLLSSLALASVAGAQSYATATSTTRVSYDAPSTVRVLSLVGETYNRYADGTLGTDGEDLGGTVQLGHTQDASGSFDAATRTFDITSTVSASLSSTDYGAVPRVFPDGAFQSVFYGYRYFLQLHNTTAVDATISFRGTLGQTSSGFASSPYGRVSFNPDGSYTPGAYADADRFGGITNRSTEAQLGDGLPNVFGGFAATAYATNPGVSTPTFSSSNPYDFTATYVLPKGQIQTFQIYASSAASAQFIPQAVPEPASLAALGLGALAMLRRRKRA